MAVHADRARAKVNLTLHVLGRRSDGYHELDSLVAFADIGDVLEVDTGGERGLAIDGPFAARIEGENLIERAVALALAAWPGARSGRFRLTKNLPVAAGLGGGSADAAAALRLLSHANAGLAGEPDWPTLARQLGADVPVCLASRLSHMGGIGERVTVLPPGEPLPAVLVNPMVPLSTAEVFRALRAGAVSWERAATSYSRRDAGLRAILAGRNDLEAPAVRLCPVIAEVLDELRASGALVARLSGSGPTCFGLFEDEARAGRAARRIARSRGAWWVRPSMLG
jgi:4-diphosphocytidyl-2-C-methyl-D-erythritol kinase